MEALRLEGKLAAKALEDALAARSALVPQLQDAQVRNTAGLLSVLCRCIESGLLDSRLSQTRSRSLSSSCSTERRKRGSRLDNHRNKIMLRTIRKRGYGFVTAKQKLEILFLSFRGQ